MPEARTGLQDATPDSGRARPDAPPGTRVTPDEALEACAGGATVLTVNRRLAREWHERLGRSRVEAGASWWETPAILPLSSWLVELHDAALTGGESGRARLSPLVAQRRWAALVRRGPGKLLDVDNAAREAMRAWQLGHSWRCLPEADAYLPEDQRVWRRWSEGYAQRLDEDGLVDAATLADHLIELAGRGALALPERVVLAGFLSPTPQQLDVVRAVEAAGTAVLVAADAEPVRARCTSWADDATELHAIADAVHARLAVEPRAALGVVVPDLEARRGEVLRAFDARFFPAATPAEIERVGRPYDVSLGGSLTDVPPVRTAMLVLGLAFERLDRHGASALLLSPYLRAAADEGRRRERLERKLREWRVRSLDLQRFTDRLDDDSKLRRPLRQLEKRLRTLRKGRRSSLADWADRFGDALVAFGWPGEDLSSEEYQSVRALHGVLDDLQALEDGETVSLSDALADVRRLARERVFQPETPDLPVRILGRLESHGLRFDTLWVAGLDTDHWPPTGAPSPFLPVVAQKEAGMPEASPEARLALALREFDHWRASAVDVRASHALERGGQPLVPAAVLVDIESGAFEHREPAMAVRAAAFTESVQDACGPVTPPGANVPGGAKLLEDQAKCPFRAFARHRLGVRALEETGIGQDPRQRGTRLHRALEFFWQDVRSHAGLVALDAPSLDERVHGSVDASLAEDEFMDDALRALERVRLVALLHEWIETCERPREPFEVQAFEQEIEFERGGVAVRLKIDRIDRVDGRLMVLDYKSGTGDSVAPWSDERIANPQLPLYALAEADVAGVAFARVAPFGCRFLGISGDAHLLPGVGPGDPPRTWEGWREHWRAALDRTTAEIRGGEAGVRPMADACTHCELRGLCRIDSVSAGDGRDEEDGAGSFA